MLLRSTGLSVDMDMDRTGAMMDVDRERGGTMRDTAGAAVERAGGAEVYALPYPCPCPGRQPGFDTVRDRGGTMDEDDNGPAILAVADDTEGRDSTMDVERVTELELWMPAVWGRRSGLGTPVRVGTLGELVTDGAAVLDSREPDETRELADALDWVRLRDMDFGRSMDVMLSESPPLRRSCENVEETEWERLRAVSGDGENALGARERLPAEVDFES